MTLRFISTFSLVSLLAACSTDGDGDDTLGSTSDASTGSASESATATATATEGTDESTTDATDTAEDTSTAGETDPSDTTSADDSTSTGGGEVVEVRNTPEVCKAGEVVAPILPDEAGHLAATTLTPPSYPFEVTQVAYDLLGTDAPGACDSTLAHRVELYVIEGAAPPADPADAVSSLTIDVDADEAAVEERIVTLDLEAPIVLAEGQVLVVAVEMVGNDELSASACVRACRDTGGIAELDWWSNAAAVPYAWADMVGDFGFISNFNHRMTGHTP